MNRLSTARLVLEPFGPRFLTERYVSWLNDPAVVRYSEQRHHAHDLASCRAWTAQFDDGSHALWAIVEREDERHIGNIAAYVDVPNGVGDLSILIGERDYQGQGLGLEAWLVVCGHLFEERGLRKVTAGTMAVNHPMLALMRKAGMREDGRRQQQFLLEGEPVDAVHAALFAAGWPRRTDTAH